MAATKGKLELVKYFKEKGADIDYVHPATKMTAFHLAAFDNYEDIVNYLAKSGADIQKKMKGDILFVVKYGRTKQCKKSKFSPAFCFLGRYVRLHILAR